MIQFAAAARGLGRSLPPFQHTLLLATLVSATLTASPAFTQPSDPPGATRHYLWISPDELNALPTSGTAWNSLLTAASASCGTPDLVDQDDNANVCVMAKALVFARTGNTAMRSAVVSALESVVILNANYGGRALALGRELAAYVIAADLIDLPAYDPSLHREFSDRIRYLRTAFTTDGPDSLIECHEVRPNNWGTHCGASRIAVSAYLGDTTDIARAAQVFKGWLGDYSSYAKFSFGDLSWQYDTSRPVGVNPLGATKDGKNIDGVLPDDLRRAGGFTWPPPQENYVYEALQGALVQAIILHRLGHDVFNWQDRALLRAFQWLHTQAAFPAEGDDTWQPWVMNYYYGTSFPAPLPARAGKNVGWTDWTHSVAGGGSGGGGTGGGGGGSGDGGGTSPRKPKVTGARGKSGSTLTVSWTADAGPAPTSHQLFFYQGGVHVATIPHGASNTFVYSLPPGIAGTFAVVVTPYSGTMPGPPSDAYTFTIDRDGPGCPAMAAPAPSGGVAQGFASVRWPAVTDAIGYVIAVGTTAGSADLIPPTFVGSALTVGAPVPPGFQAWVRVYAVNACAQLGPGADVLVK